jgi:flagellar biosynthetic protein FliR
MSLDNALQLVPTFVLVFFRLAGLMIFAPLLGSSRIPRQVKVMIALVLAAGMCGSIHAPVALPPTIWGLTLGIAGEMAFGLAMGMILSFTFIAAQWAGEMVGQQLGLNISEVIDPEFGQSNSVVSDLYFMLTLTIFLLIGGHREMIRGIRSSFDTLPLLSLGVDRPLFDTLVGLFQVCTTLAMRLAAPVLVTMLVVDLALGCIGKAMPQMNIMTVGLSVRSLIGLAVIIVGLGLTVAVLSGSVTDAMKFAQVQWATPR